jgi:hypothetical protein
MLPAIDIYFRSHRSILRPARAGLFNKKQRVIFESRAPLYLLAGARRRTRFLK